jgi:hypothetical protein
MGFLGLSLLAFAPLASHVVNLVTRPPEWLPFHYSGIVISPVAFVFAIIQQRLRNGLHTE